MNNEFLGFIWNNPKTIIRNKGIVFNIHFTVFYITNNKDKDKDCCEAFEKAMNELTNNEFGSLSSYVISESIHTVKGNVCDFIYRRFILSGKDKVYVIVDKNENEQPGITDITPTSDMSNLRVGKMINGNVLQSLIKTR